MHINETTVRHIARLARIRVSDGDVARLEGELSGILDWVEQLSEVDTGNVDPLTTVVERAMERRTDAVTDGDCAGAVLANAPERADSFFVVPKVVE